LALATLLLVVDLYAYGLVLDGTYNATWPREVVQTPPDVLTFLAQEETPYRIYTREEILPVLPVARESLYPNMAMRYGVSSANIYSPLVPRRYADYMEGLSAERLNRMNVRYVLIPQLLPVDEARELYDVENPFAALPLNEWLDLPSQRLSRLDVESYLSHAADLTDGTPVAEIVLRDAQGQTVSLLLRAGRDTAEWAYEREDVAEQIAHGMAPVASRWPARSGFPPREHVGHTYRARLALDEPFRATAIRLVPLRPAAFVRLERVTLVDVQGEAVSLGALLGLGDHAIVYRSEDVLIYRNHGALPRAYTVPHETVAMDDDGVTLPARLSQGDVVAAQVVAYNAQEVVLQATVEEPSYLVLADLYYPGWAAYVDGVPQRIVPVDGVFRGVALEPGTHRVVFRYEPPWVVW
jgi:hypothetical protein